MTARNIFVVRVKIQPAGRLFRIRAQDMAWLRYEQEIAEVAVNDRK